MMSFSGSDVAAVMKAAQSAAANMLKSKQVCPSCKSVFCLECGNAKGRNLGTGSTHCPKCGTKVV
jgi:membrane protease subunit (stomatin/prohibitin family)